MDLKNDKERHRDIAINVFQDSNNPPQVRARAYIYADAMQSILRSEVERPSCIPSLALFQREMIAVVLRSFADSTRNADGAFPLGLNQFFGWSEHVRKEPNEGLNKEATYTSLACIQLIQHEYRGVPLKPDDWSEIYRFIALQAFAVIPTLITSIADAQSDFAQLVLRIHRDAWGEDEYMTPLLKKEVIPIFTIQPTDETEQAPAIVGYMASCHRMVFYWGPEDKDVERLIREGGSPESVIQNIVAGSLDGDDSYARVKRQARLNRNIHVAIEALDQGVYPSLPGVIPEQFVQLNSAMFATP